MVTALPHSTQLIATALNIVTALSDYTEHTASLLPAITLPNAQKLMRNAITLPVIQRTMFSTPAPPCLLHREQRSVPLPHLACYTKNSVQYPCAVPSCLLYREQCSVLMWLSHLACYTENSVQYPCPILPFTHCLAPSPLPCLLQRYTLPVTQRRVCRTLPVIHSATILRT